MNKEEKIKELQDKLNRLKQKKVLVEKPIGLGNSFEEIGKTFGQIKDFIPKKKEEPNEPKREFFYDKSTDKARRILFWTLLIVVGGTALALVIRSMILKFIK